MFSNIYDNLLFVGTENLVIGQLVFYASLTSVWKNTRKRLRRWIYELKYSFRNILINILSVMCLSDFSNAKVPLKLTQMLYLIQINYIISEQGLSCQTIRKIPEVPFKYVKIKK